MEVKNTILSNTDVPKYYEGMKEKITISFLQKIYFEKMKFIYLDFESNQDNNESFLSDNLNENRFYSYHIIDQKAYKTIFPNNMQKTKEKDSSYLVNIIICTENKCYIVENIHTQTINSILEKTNSFFLNINEKQAKKEIYSIYSHFKKEIDSNPFVKYTFSTIICYLIRRFFYPTSFFKNSSFFNFQSKSNEKTQDFNENDFIFLRVIYTGENKNIHLAFHIESFYIFSIKKICQDYYDPHLLELETNFCKNFSHRCLTKFYGFLKYNETIEGFVYEFMSNGSLFDFIQNNKNEKSYFFSFIAINRIFQGIFYLHSNSVIHRDLHPSNILINHDYLTYLSDYETAIKVDSSDPNAYTQDIGSISFGSIEQQNNLSVSFKTDIYSFGVNIYFLFERKIFNRCSKMTKFATSIQKLYQNCIKFDENERPDFQIIIKELIDHLLSIDSLKYYFQLEKTNQVQPNEIIQFYNENIHLLSLENDDLNLKKYQQDFPDASQLLCYIGNIFYEGKNVQQNFLKAKEFYEISAKQNNSNALCYLGDLYRNGEGVKKDIIKAREYYELSAKQNNADALDHLGNIYNFGQGVEKDYFKAKEYYELAAKQDNADALYSIGYYYFVGRVVEKDLDKALRFYKKSAEYNFSPALNGLGNYYFINPNIKENVQKGLECYKKAAELNNSNALLNIGNIYLNGSYYIEKNYQKAINYYEKAAELHNIDALIALGNIYYLGNGVEKDFSKTIKYFTLAAEEDCADAYNFLGFLYDSGQGVKKDYSIAKKYFEKAAAKNHPNALNNLGNIYLHGCGIAHDYLKAKELFEKSSKLGNARAFFLLGNLYFEGLGPKQSYLEAIKYYEIAAEKNFSKAMYALGDIYYKGLGIEKNFQISKTYYEKAFNSKYLQASFQLGVIYYYGRGVNRDYENARKYFEISSGMNDLNSFFYLGKIYEDGKGIPININKAIEFYLQCVKKKNEIAKITYNQGWTFSYIDNAYYYHSYNNLGLIYAIIYENKELAEKYLKAAGLNEFPLGQNNLALFYQFYSNRIDDAIHFYSKSAQNNFSLPEFNLGHIEEIRGNIDKSIEHFLNAIEYENDNKYSSIDEYLLYSKIYIICLTNLKLFMYFSSHKEYKYDSKAITPKKYLINAFFRPLFYNLFYSNCSFSFKFDINHNGNDYNFLNLKNYFLGFPLFFNSHQNNDWNIIEQNEEEKNKTIKNKIEIELKEGLCKIINSQNKNLVEVEEEIENIYKSIIKNDEFQVIDLNTLNNDQKDKLNDKQKKEYSEKNRVLNYIMNNTHSEKTNQTKIIKFKSINDSIVRSLEYPLFLEEMFTQDLNQMIPKIDEITKIMNDILYTYPYQILFGRIGKESMKQEDKRDKIDDLFYDGFKDD